MRHRTGVRGSRVCVTRLTVCALGTAMLSGALGVQAAGAPGPSGTSQPASASNRDNTPSRSAPPPPANRSDFSGGSVNRSAPPPADNRSDFSGGSVSRSAPPPPASQSGFSGGSANRSAPPPAASQSGFSGGSPGRSAPPSAAGRTDFSGGSVNRSAPPPPAASRSDFSGGSVNRSAPPPAASQSGFSGRSPNTVPIGPAAPRITSGDRGATGSASLGARPATSPPGLRQATRHPPRRHRHPRLWWNGRRRRRRASVPGATRTMDRPPRADPSGMTPPVRICQGANGGPELEDNRRTRSHPVQLPYFSRHPQATGLPSPMSASG